MKNLLYCALATGVLASCHSAHKATNALTATERQNGWQLLFDGTTLNGWHPYNHRTDVHVWTVSNSSLHIDTTAKGPGADLITDEEYENYDLKMEWKISPKGNSGIIFNVQEDPQYRATYVTGPEMQIIDNNGHPDAKIHKHRAGDLYDLIASSQETVKPVGEWNQAEIIQNNKKLELRLNGVTVVTTVEGDANWDQLVANSKFKNMANFNKVARGRIALQDHGGDLVSFRNIKIKKL